MERNRIDHSGTGARPAVEVLRSLLTLRANKDSMKKKDYKSERALLWAQAELTVETDDNTLAKAAPDAPRTHQHGGAAITERPDLQYEAERNLAGEWMLRLSTEEREYIERKLRDDRKEGVPAADRILHNLGYQND